jgi:hypothetical protein
MNEKPMFIYMFHFEDDIWTYCYYDLDKAKEKAIEITMEYNLGYKFTA